MCYSVRYSVTVLFCRSRRPDAGIKNNDKRHVECSMCRSKLVEIVRQNQFKRVDADRYEVPVSIYRYSRTGTVRSVQYVSLVSRSKTNIIFIKLWETLPSPEFQHLNLAGFLLSPKP
jgi:hypothetical protein